MAKLYCLPLSYCKSLSIQVSLPTPQHPNTFSRKNFENNRRKSTQVLCSTYWISTRIRWQPLGPCIGQSAEHAFPPIIELAHKLHHVSFIVYNLLDGGNYYAHRFISCVYTMYFTIPQYISPVIRALIKATIVLFGRDNYTFTKPLPWDPFVLVMKGNAKSNVDNQ